MVRESHGSKTNPSKAYTKAGVKPRGSEDKFWIVCSSIWDSFWGGFWNKSVCKSTFTWIDGRMHAGKDLDRKRQGFNAGKGRSVMRRSGTREAVSVP